MPYLEIEIPASSELHEILIAELSFNNYDSFQEQEDQLMAYILEEDFSEEVLKDILSRYNVTNSFKVSTLENKNWNEEWEKNFDPITVNDDCYVRATFHEEKGVPYEIIINPRMTFGTGHHSTTQLMMRTQFDINHEGKTVIDAGCGTAVLAVLAKKLRASTVSGNDIDEWAYENALENCKLNDCHDINIAQGTAEEVFDAGNQVDILLANINKNVLLSELDFYSQLVKSGGQLLLSGFYEKDIEDIAKKASSVGFTKLSYKTLNAWACILFDRQ